MGFLTGDPATTSSSSSSQTNTYVDPGGQYYPLMQNVFGVAQNTLNRPYQDYSTDQRFAGFTPDQQQAMQGIRNAQGSWQPAFNQAQGNYNAASNAAGGVGQAGMAAFNRAMASPGALGAATPYAQNASQSWTDPGVAQQWMNPYTSQVTQATADQANRAFSAPGGALQQMTDAFTGGNAGQFGRNRMGDVANNLSYNFGQGLGAQLGNINMQGYNQGMSAFGQQQALQGQLAGTMGGLGASDVGQFGNLGTQLVNQANAGVGANINAGAGQTAFGQAGQQANYADLATLMGSGQQQQAFGQQQADFDYQKFLTQQNWDVTNASLAQSLAQGWQLPTQVNSQSQSQSTSTPATGSILGQILGGGLSIAGLGTGGGGTVGGGIANWIGSLGKAHGGHVPRRAFAAGGYAPVVSMLRQSAMQRQPAQMQRLQAFQQGQGGPQAGGPPPGAMPPGMMPGGPAGPPQPPMGGPQPAFARGGHVDADQDRGMMRRAVWAHERNMHDASDSDLTPLKRFAFGGPVGFDDGGSVEDALFDNMDYGGQFLRAHPEAEQRAFTLSPEERYRVRQARAAENAQRASAFQQEAASDPRGYWGDVATQLPRGVASMSELAGLPGSVLNEFGYDTGLPTTEGIDRVLNSAFGDARTSGGRASRRVGEMLPMVTGLGEASTPLLRGLSWGKRLGRAAHQLGMADNLASAFGGE